MATREYTCKKCGMTLLRSEDIGVAPKPPLCPTCGTKMKQVFHPTPMVWKGGKPSA